MGHNGTAMWLSWELAALLAFALAVAAWVARRGASSGAAAFANEASVVSALYAVWQLVGNLPTRTVAGATAHGLSIWHIEQRLHLPSELAMERAVLRHPLVMQAANGLYAVVHVPALGLFLVWLWVAHREQYARFRNVLAVLTFVCLVSHLYPVAPPRLLPGIGFVDPAVLFHQSVYGPVGAGISDQVSAMPSLHVAWAGLIALAVIQVSRSRWRWLILLHPIMTVVVVVITANHFWLDGVVGLALLALALPVVGIPELLAQRRPAPAADAGPVPVLEHA